MFYLVSQNRIENRAARTIMAVFILAMMAMSCVSYPRQQHDNATLTQRMNKLRAAPLVIIHCHNPETTNDFRFVVSNSVGLIRLQHALPEWYMVRSRPLRNKYKPDEKQLLASIAYANKDLARMDNGMYITPEVLFVLSNGVVFHGRGNLMCANWHGSLLPEYRDVVCELCKKYEQIGRVE